MPHRKKMYDDKLIKKDDKKGGMIFIGMILLIISWLSSLDFNYETKAILFLIILPILIVSVNMFVFMSRLMKGVYKHK
jgi:hypothetical protein